MTGYEYSRTWFDWCFENPEKIKPNHTALYFFCIEHCNRMGWKEKFGLPTNMAKEAIGIKSYNTYSETLYDLVKWGFIKMVEKSKNQYSSNIIALSKFDKALDKALDKATVKHVTKQVYGKGESIDSINKPLTINQEQETINHFDVDSEFINVLVDEFGFTEMRFAVQQKKVMEFVKVLSFTGQLDNFKNQYKHYKEFKRASGQQVHSFSSLIGTVQEKFSDGAWNAENWEHKLKEQMARPEQGRTAVLKVSKFDQNSNAIEQTKQYLAELRANQ